MSTAPQTPSALAMQAETAELGAALAGVRGLPPRKGYAQLLGGATGLTGPFVRAETGWHPWQNWALYAGGGYEASTGWQVGGGLRWDWD